MPIRFQCPACGAVIEADDEHAGAEGPCPNCRQRLQVPAPALARYTLLDRPLEEPTPGDCSAGPSKRSCRAQPGDEDDRINAGSRRKRRKKKRRPRLLRVALPITAAALILVLFLLLRTPSGPFGAH